ncbi:MAG: IPT/TIG domain-containing protein [Planctomycetes bacterium]|nr:IPT/TIG domain-containing protein [Planctomycetota bacterium]
MPRSTAVALAMLCAPLAAQAFQYPNFNAAGQLNLLGSAALSGNSLRLTANVSNQSGWAWRQEAWPVVNGFDTTFAFRITPPQFGTKAEGMAFVIHAGPNGNAATGGTVWGMGYGVGANNSAGLPNSIAIELDTYLDPFLSDTSANELTIHTRGTFGNNENEIWSIARTTLPGNFSDGQPHTLRVVYVPGTLQVYYDGAAAPALSVAYDLVQGGQLLTGNAVSGIGATAGVAHVGFCATTGAGSLTELCEVLSWDWASTPLTDPCYVGTLGADTLTVNGSAGGFFRRVEVATHQAFDVAVLDPPGFGAGAPYLLFASLLPQPNAPGAMLGFGNACFPMLPPGSTELVLADTFGFGAGLVPAGPTPFTIAVPQGGLTFPIELTLQAATLASPTALGLTNAVELGVVVAPPPTIASVLPLSAAVGSTITVNGAGFVPGASVSVAGAPVVVTSFEPDRIEFAYPAGLGCDAALVVSNPDGKLVTATLNPTPVITGTVLGTGPAAGGAVFLVQGQGFAPGTTVTIGGAPANVIGASSNAVTMNTPPGSVGVAAVVVTTPGGCTAQTTYTYQ